MCVCVCVCMCVCANNGSDNYERKNTATAGKLIIAIYASYLYRVTHKSLRDFRNRLRNNQDRHGRKEHINR